MCGGSGDKGGQMMEGKLGLEKDEVIEEWETRYSEMGR